MPEIRKNQATKEWVIVPTEQAQAPETFKLDRGRELKVSPQDCPFCPGNESRTPHETLAYRSFGSKINERGWWVRIVPDQMKFLIPEGEPKHEDVLGYFPLTSGVGHHEIIIETPNHQEFIGFMNDKQVEEVFLAYRERYLNLSRSRRTQMVTFFTNHGVLGGAQVEHCHSHILATPLVPLRIRHHMEEARYYYEDKGTCVYCAMLHAELKFKERVVLETEQYVVFEPFASLTPFETWIMPKTHHASFGQVPTEEVKHFAQVVNQTIKRIEQKLSFPDYNSYIFTSPVGEQGVPYYHWYMQITPRINPRSKYDIGSGNHVNPCLPEEAARFLREQ